MKIIIGTKNKAKVEAVMELVPEYPIFHDAEIIAVEVDSGVSDQPKGMEETIIGAQNRARKAYESVEKASVGIGLESGIFSAPHTKTGFLDTTACVLFDGHEFHLGFSSCFEYPKKLIEIVEREGVNISQAAQKAGYSADDKLGSAEGMIGLLTKGRVNRKEYTKQAIITAMIHLENKDQY